MEPEANCVISRASQLHQDAATSLTVLVHLQSRIQVRVICTRAYHALFMHNMMIRPTEEELEELGEPDFVIYNAGACPADPAVEGVGSTTCVVIDVDNLEMVILGTEYAGEMKKGIFSVMHYLMPLRGKLTLHSGCNIGADGDVSLFFGLSGTGMHACAAEHACTDCVQGHLLAIALADGSGPDAADTVQERQPSLQTLSGPSSGMTSTAGLMMASAISKAAAMPSASTFRRRRSPTSSMLFAKERFWRILWQTLKLAWYVPFMGIFVFCCSAWAGLLVVLQRL
jgi:hypothetical protein